MDGRAIRDRKAMRANVGSIAVMLAHLDLDTMPSIPKSALDSGCGVQLKHFDRNHAAIGINPFVGNRIFP